jgi:hypothetical protein
MRVHGFNIAASCDGFRKMFFLRRFRPKVGTRYRVITAVLVRRGAQPWRHHQRERCSWRSHDTFSMEKGSTYSSSARSTQTGTLHPDRCDTRHTLLPSFCDEFLTAVVWMPHFPVHVAWWWYVTLHEE